MKNKVKKVISDKLGIDVKVIKSNTLLSTLDCDDLILAEVLVELEDTFNVCLFGGDFPDFKTVGDLMDKLTKLGVKEEVTPANGEWWMIEHYRSETVALYKGGLFFLSTPVKVDDVKLLYKMVREG